MNLLINGCGVQRRGWKVEQETPAGYSRVYYILSGRVCYRDAQIKKQLRHGCLYVFPASAPYRIEHDPMHPIECLWFHIDFFPYDIDRLLELEVRLFPTLERIVEALELEGGQRGERAPLFLSLVDALYHTILRHCDVRRTDARMVEILQYMRSHYTEHALSVQALARRFGYSTAHFIRLFRSAMGVTPHRYLETLRLSFAAERLLEGVGVTRAAAESGYLETKTFSRAFRAVYGVAPSEYARFFMPQA